MILNHGPWKILFVKYDTLSKGVEGSEIKEKNISFLKSQNVQVFANVTTYTLFKNQNQ